ncbi:MAG: hypothetical protein GWO20_08605 [Candidatus Korarchaeota archaeon]|nr:hypothetical protein [Candidatus Korarchaeota archaeon]NIU83448.1 hypothetical protein [Candidatus Thorarchaeota archaeon]NIW13724.1 hypothetical protein [Candidatus Thorarchaeota archaeon]NIW51819.1 hypothetical protein [Candidatus Korarchaeota archaeon]
MKAQNLASFYLLFLLGFQPLVTGVASVSYEPGCREGQYVKMDLTWNYRRENIPDYMEPNKSEILDTMRIEVTNVKGANVTIQEKLTYEDDHSHQYTVTYSIKERPLHFPVIAGGLNESVWWINGTTTKYCWRLGQMFTMNYLTYEAIGCGEIRINGRRYWHKETGLLMKLEQKAKNIGSGDIRWTMESSFVETNVGGIPWLWVIPAIAVVAVVAFGVAVYVLKVRKS